MAIRHVAIAFFVCLVFNLIFLGKLHDFEEEKCARKKKGIYLMIYVNVFVSSCADIQHTSFHERAGFVQNGTICCWYAISDFLSFMS